MACSYYVSKDIDLGTFTSNQAAGSDQGTGSQSGGFDYSLVGDLNHRVRQITVMLNDERNYVSRVIIVKNDQTCSTIGGNQYSDSKVRELTWHFQPNEQLTRIRLYCTNNRFAGFIINTNIQQNIVCLLEGVTESSPHLEIPVGSGKWMGVFGNCGGIVDSLGFAMCKN